MRYTYTPDGLRLLAKELFGPQWEGEARAALIHAADVLDAADAVIKEQGAVPPGYALAMAVLQSSLYQRLDDVERAECDALIAAPRPPQGDMT